MQCEINKELGEIELILIDLWARSLDPAVFPFAHWLDEYPQIVAEMKIGEQHVTLQQVAFWALRLLSPERIVRALITFADFTAKRKVPVPSRVEWYVFKRIPEIITTCGIAQVTEVVIVSSS